MTKPNNSLPLVTVYMPTYNRVALLQRAVESVLGQDYRNIELIVVDDNSTDGTHQYLAEMAEKDSRFRYFINEENSGACVSRNKAIFAANGEYITGLDDDDYFLPHHISNFVNFWRQSDDDFIALYANHFIKDTRGLTRTSNKITSCESQDLICSNWIGNQIFTRTSNLRRINAFDDHMLAWQDLECWYRLLKIYDKKAALIKEPSYVVDISHPHERISTGKIDSVTKSYNYFCRKHNLTNSERDILQLQLNYYTRKVPNLTSIIKSIIYVPKPYNIKRSIVRTISPIIRKLR